MGGLIGSGPKVTQSDLPTIDPAQQALLSSLAGSLGSSQGAGAALNFGQLQPSLNANYAAPLSNLQQTSLTGIENLVNSFTGGAPDASGGVATGMANINKASSNPVGMIDATNAFQTGVVQPLTQDFTQQTIPSINANYGRSAGGGFSTDALGARQTAGTNLARTLAQTGSQYSLQAGEANQAAQGTNAQLGLAANQQLAQVLGLPLTLAGAQENLLQTGLTAGAVPQQTQQTQITGQEADFQSILTQIQQKIADALGLSTAGTQQPQTVVQPATTGLLQALLGGAASGAARGLVA
jgi:hypothetical protein